MTSFNAGDIVTFHLRDNLYGVAKILLIENLAINDNVHLSIHDRVVEANEPDVDIHGDLQERGHEFDGEITTTPLITHLALTYEAFMASLPMKVDAQEVEDAELEGYQLWLHNRYQHAVRQGMIREREDQAEEDLEEEIEEELEEDPEEQMQEESEQGDEAEEELAPAEGDTDSGDAEDADTPQNAEAPQPKGAWAVMSLEDVPVGRWLFQQHDSIRDAEILSKSELGRYILSHYDDSNIEEIEELVKNFVNGDYGAGHELLDFGDTAANALARELTLTGSTELVEDILRILGDMGNDRAYHHIAAYFEEHSDLAGDPMAPPAARAYCYAVMLTGGDPEPLRPHLASIAALQHPELADDRKAALEAIAAAERNMEN